MGLSMTINICKNLPSWQTGGLFFSKRCPVASCGPISQPVVLIENSRSCITLTALFLPFARVSHGQSSMSANKLFAVAGVLSDVPSFLAEKKRNPFADSPAVKCPI